MRSISTARLRQLHQPGPHRPRLDDGLRTGGTRDGQTSPSWISSTAFSDYLLAHPERATYLGSDRSHVKVGDVAQFDWDASGDLDHTATVTRVDHTADGMKVYVGGHTKDIDYWDVDDALATGGGNRPVLERQEPGAAGASERPTSSARSLSGD